MVEPEWDEQSRALVLGETEYASRLCPRCGRPMSVCQAPENEFAFYAPDPVRCHATTALLAKQKGYSEEKNPGVQALLWSTVLRDEENPGG